MSHHPARAAVRRGLCRSALVIGLLALSLMSPATAGAASAEPMSPGCQAVHTEVPSSVLGHQVVPIPAVNLLGPADLEIHGRLCLPATGAPKTVLLAQHGITYDSEYWDAQYQPGTYSFARAMTAAGYAVFAIDRLGYGGSDHPLSALVTLDVQAEVAHQMIQQLKAGQIGKHRFGHVILVGHSYGSAISWLESSKYNDADAVIATGWGSVIQTLPLARFFASMYPASLDPKFQNSGYDPGYLTPLPGGREQDFLYDQDNVDPKMIDYDQNVLRDTVTAGEGVTFYNRYRAIPVAPVPTTDEELELPLSDHTKNIHVPTFLLNGTNEQFFCGPDTRYCRSGHDLQQREAPYFSRDACLQAAVIPHAGHDLNLQRNAQDSYAVIRNWADKAVGPNGNKVNSYRANC